MFNKIKRFLIPKNQEKSQSNILKKHSNHLSNKYFNNDLYVDEEASGDSDTEQCERIAVNSISNIKPSYYGLRNFYYKNRHIIYPTAGALLGLSAVGGLVALSIFVPVFAPVAVVASKAILAMTLPGFITTVATATLSVSACVGWGINKIATQIAYAQQPKVVFPTRNYSKFNESAITNCNQTPPALVNSLPNNTKSPINLHPSHIGKSNPNSVFPENLYPNPTCISRPYPR